MKKSPKKTAIFSPSTILPNKTTAINNSIIHGIIEL